VAEFTNADIGALTKLIDACYYSMDVIMSLSLSHSFLVRIKY